MAEHFSVWQWFPEDFHERVGSGLTAWEAVELAHSYTVRPAGLMGAIRKVSVVCEEDDTTVFLWEWGKGVVFPALKPAALDAAGHLIKRS